MVIDTETTLADGRTLAYTDCGERAGRPVMYFHGAPTSRLDLVGFDEELAALGLRVISADRPGFGRSSPQPGRGLDDWPVDVAALADHLGIDRFPVVGLSAGGPYAVATAALLGDRVCGVGVVNGVTDMGWPDAWVGYDEMDATIMRLGDESQAIAWCEEHYGSDGSNFFSFAQPMSAADNAVLEHADPATGLFASVIEAFRQGVVGLAGDLTVQGRPWPFDPGTITAPAIVLHGTEDTLLPIAHGRHTAEVIPGATFIALEGEGHISPVTRIPRLCADLVAGCEGSAT